jgi:hypothetical protein
MATKKWEKYILTEPNPPEWRRAQSAKHPDKSTMIAWLSDEVIKGAFHVEVVWFHPGVNTITNTAHTHDFDEVVGFLGSDAAHPKDLGGEVEWWQDDEQYILHNSAIIWVPKGLKHAPMVIRRVDRPILHFTIMLSGKYTASNKPGV